MFRTIEGEIQGGQSSQKQVSFKNETISNLKSTK